MALSRNEIQKKSDTKRGIVQKNFKLRGETVELLARLAEHTGKPQNNVLADALAAYAEKMGLENQ